MKDLSQYGISEFQSNELIPDAKQAFLLCWLMQNFEAFKESDLTFREAAELFERVWSDPLYGVLH